jgi:hypothetical protein
MPEPEKTDTAESAKTPRSFSLRAERSLKETDRLLKNSPNSTPHEQAMTQAEQAKVFALLDLAEAIRENRES